MFNKSFKAKVRSASISSREVRGSDERRVVCSLRLQYDFTEQCAAEIGGDAVQLQQMLAEGKERSVKLDGCKVTLDTKTVRIKMGKGSDKTEVDRTLGLTAKAKTPNAEDPYPTLSVTARFDLGDVDISFLARQVEQSIPIRMDRQQLELPATGPEGEEAAA